MSVSVLSPGFGFRGLGGEKGKRSRSGVGLGTSTPTPGALKAVIALQGRGLGQRSKQAEAAEPVHLAVQGRSQSSWSCGLRPGRDRGMRARAEEDVFPPGGLAGPLNFLSS